MMGSAGSGGTSWEAVKWNPDLDDWTCPAAAGSQLTAAIESMHQRPLPSLQVFCLFASVLQRTLAKLENAPDSALRA